MGEKKKEPGWGRRQEQQCSVVQGVVAGGQARVCGKGGGWGGGARWGVGS